MRLSFLLLLALSFGTSAEPSPERQQQLVNLLKHDCGSCHGLPPKGGLGPSLLPDVLTGKSDGLLMDAIQNGRPGTAMPPWRQFLSDNEALWIIQQLRKGQ